MERQFEKDFGKTSRVAKEVTATEDVTVEDDPVPLMADRSDGDDEFKHDESTSKIPANVKQMVEKLRINTGHRSNKRLARALLVAGAPAQVVACAKRLKCAVCQERKPLKASRPASLPMPKDINDQVHVDLFEAFDSAGTRYYIVHIIDWASRFQMAEVLDDKSSASVERFLQKRWFPFFGAPPARSQTPFCQGA